ncbi:MAG TPA: hypothetical protein VGF12_07035 [Roseateles sp.]
MDLHALERLVEDCANQPEWRNLADKAASYMDGKQLSAAKLAQHEETGEPSTIVNLIARTVNGALGNEAKARTDWRANADAGAFTDVAEVLSERLKEAQRESFADLAISDAYRSQLVPGIGWVEVSRSPDVLAYPYRVNCVHRNEVWWDWRGRDPDINTKRWVCRQQWVDLDEAVLWFPQFRDVFELGCHSGVFTDAMQQTILASERFDDLHDIRSSYSRQQEEWLDNALRRRVRFYDIHYRVPKIVVALVAGTRRVLFNERNPLHLALLQRGKAQLVKGPSYKIRRALFCGPFRLFDVETKLRKYPLIPFFCYRDDEKGTPYGLVAGMIDPQDEYNERRSRLRWLLKAKQTYVDSDAMDPKFNTLRDLALEVMRPDGFFVMNKDRKNKDALRVEQNLQLSNEQVMVMQDAKQLIQDVPGIYSALLGSGADGVRSGTALNSLVEQSITSLGETNDNYRYARTAVGDALADLIVEDLSQPELQVEVGAGKKARVIVLNTFTPEGIPVNHVQDAPTRIGLGDVPSTPAFRAQTQAELGNALAAAGNDPIARGVLLPAYIESTNLENRHLYAKWLRQKYGVPEPGEEAEVDQDPAAEQLAKQQQEALAQAGQELQMRGATADVAKKEADAALTAAKAQREGALTQIDLAQAAQPAQEPQFDPQADEDARIQAALAEAA